MVLTQKFSWVLHILLLTLVKRGHKSAGSQAGGQTWKLFMYMMSLCNSWEKKEGLQDEKK